MKYITRVCIMMPNMYFVNCNMGLWRIVGHWGPWLSLRKSLICASSLYGPTRDAFMAVMRMSPILSILCSITTFLYLYHYRDILYSVIQHILSCSLSNHSLRNFKWWLVIKGDDEGRKRTHDALSCKRKFIHYFYELSKS